MQIAMPLGCARFGVVVLVGLLWASGQAQAASVWLDGTSGTWQTPARWVNGAIPTDGCDVVVNADGTYTSTWQNELLRTNIASLVVGTASVSGTQTVRISGNIYQAAGITGPITVGPRGIIEQLNALTDPATPTNALVQSGGIYRLTNTDSRASFLGFGRLLAVEAGGRVELGPGSGLTMAHPDSPAWSSIINGILTGAGTLAVDGGRYSRYGGTGTIDGPGTLLIPYNGTLYLAGSLTVNRSLAQNASASSMGIVRFMDGANITANGDMVWTNVQTAFVVEPGSSATVGGTGLVDITFNSANAYFAGYSWSSPTPAALTLGGTGRLALRAPGMLVTVMCNTITVSRATSMNGSGGTLGILSGRKALITGIGSGLTMETNTILRILRLNSWENTSFVRVHGGGSLKLDGARVEGYAPGADPYGLHLSDDGSAASLILAGGMSNTIAGMQSSQKLSVRLGSGAAVDVGAGAVLNLQQAALHVAITNPARWGWSTNGTLAIGAEATVEALNNDLGPRVNLKTLPFVIDRLSFTATNTTLTLAETADNDGGGSDRALYVRTLDLSALAGGTVDLDGFNGAERIYYGTLINPNGVSFVTPGEWIQVHPPVGSTVIQLR